MGPGAKCEVKDTTKVQASSVVETGNFELVSVDGDKLGTKFDLTIDAAAGKTAAAAQPNGGASGTLNVDLSKLVVSSAKLNIHMEAPMNREKTLVAKIDISMSMDSQ